MLRLTRRHPNTPEPQAPSYRLQGEVEWLLTGPPEELDAAAQDLHGIYELLSDGVALLNFGNAVGYFTVHGLGKVEVVSGKWDGADFERMLAEITEIAAGLPFSATAAASLPYDRAIVSRHDVLYHLFVYLRNILSDSTPQVRQLLPALRLIISEPHQRFTRIQHTVLIDQLRRIDATSLVRLAQGRERLFRVSSTLQASLPLAHALRGHLPERVAEGRVEITHDTAENRFVKSFLGSVEAIIASVEGAARQLERQDVFAKRMLSDCDWMAHAIRPIAQHIFWRDIGPMIHLPVSSPVLQQRRGYREVFEHFIRLRLAARIPLSVELILDLLEAKDIARLYELWSYFTLIRELRHLRGTPTHADGLRVDPFGITMPSDMAIGWADGTRLLYNPRFSRSRPHGQRSYSVPLRPDIALEVRSGPNAGLHLFDAKFKLESITDVMSADSAEDETTEAAKEERRGTFKRGDLYKMHTYRDAIPHARSVWILYPGTEFRFFSVKGGMLKAPLESSESPLEGVGAVPLVPIDRPQSNLDLLLKRLIEHAG